MPAAAEGVTNRLEVVSSEALKLKEGQDKSVKAVEAWVSKFTKKNGREPTVKDRSVGSQRKRVREREESVCEDSGSLGQQVHQEERERNDRQRQVRRGRQLSFSYRPHR